MANHQYRQRVKHNNEVSSTTTMMATTMTTTMTTMTTETTTITTTTTKRSKARRKSRTTIISRYIILSIFIVSIIIILFQNVYFSTSISTTSTSTSSISSISTSTSTSTSTSSIAETTKTITRRKRTTKYITSSSTNDTSHAGNVNSLRQPQEQQQQRQEQQQQQQQEQEREEGDGHILTVFYNVFVLPIDTINNNNNTNTTTELYQEGQEQEELVYPYIHDISRTTIEEQLYDLGTISQRYSKYYSNKKTQQQQEQEQQGQQQQQQDQQNQKDDGSSSSSFSYEYDYPYRFQVYFNTISPLMVPSDNNNNNEYTTMKNDSNKENGNMMNIGQNTANWIIHDVCTKYYPTIDNCNHLKHYTTGHEEVTLTQLHNYCINSSSSSSSSSSSLVRNQNHTGYNKRREEDIDIVDHEWVLYMHTKGSFHYRPSNVIWRRHLLLGTLHPGCLQLTIPKNRKKRNNKMRINDNGETTLHPSPSSYPSSSSFSSSFKEINNYDCNVCGLQFAPYWTNFFPGNIWLARCDYVTKLLSPINDNFSMKNALGVIELLQNNEFMKLIVDHGIFPRSIEGLWGLQRFANEHWIGSHGHMNPCDVSKTPNIDSWMRSNKYIHLNISEISHTVDEDTNNKNKFIKDHNLKNNKNNDDDDDDNDDIDDFDAVFEWHMAPRHGMANHHYRYHHHHQQQVRKQKNRQVQEEERANLEQVKRQQQVKQPRHHHFSNEIIFHRMNMTIHNDLLLERNNKKEYHRIREWYYLAGRIHRWNAIYGSGPSYNYPYKDNENGTKYDTSSASTASSFFPPDESWVWSYFPDGPLWREAIKKFSPQDVVREMARAAMIGEGNASSWEEFKKERLSIFFTPLPPLLNDESRFMKTK